MTDRMLSVLVVDDEPDARLVMRAALRKAGYEVRMAGSGQEALASFAEQPANLVMLDVDMPEMSGYEVCAALRAMAGPLLPIIMVTGMDDVRSVEAAFDSGATDFIAKPVNWALIGYRVRYLFRSHRAMMDLHAAEVRNAAVLDAIPDLLFEMDIDGRYIDYRAPSADLLAAPPEAFLGRTVSEVLPQAAARACMAALHEAHTVGSSSGRQIELNLPKGLTYFELSVSRKAGAVGAKPQFIVLSRDITERRVAQGRIEKLAYFDSLTGLPNRRSFLERVDREVQTARQSGARFAVLFLDLDGFKNINDTLGHAAGDVLLQWAAERLGDGLRPSDLVSRVMSDFDGLDGMSGAATESSLARLGGDEFTALISVIESSTDAIAVAKRMGQLMRRPFVLDGREIILTASIGIAMFPADGRDAATLLKHADTAMYLAKRSGRDNVQVYSASLTADIVQRLEFDSSLRCALERQEFHLVYQPQLDLASGRIRSVEALIRWVHPTCGQISPMCFIPLAEENGLIERIGLWVLRTACAQAAAWLAAGTPLTVAVNLSPLQFATPDLPQVVMQVLAQAGLPPALLELEITEGALMDNTITTRAALNALRGQGVRIALDDFGTGYSSLAYLTRMPIGNIKIDKCFVSGLLDDDESKAIVRAVLAMAHSLGMNVTAEGVETLAQAQALKAMNCQTLQGYYFSRPVLPGMVVELLEQCWQIDFPAQAADSVLQSMALVRSAPLAALA